MRLSSIRGDKGYKPASVLAQFRVFFNDVERRDCVVADSDEGYIQKQRTAKHTSTGKLIKIISARIYGKVEIVKVM